MNPNIKGLLTEMTVQQEFIKRGFGVSIPLNPSERYDMILDAFGGLFKVQIKTSSDIKSGDGFMIWTQSVHKINGKWDHKRYYPNEVDLFATVHDDKVYVIPYSDIGKQSQLTLRTDSHRTNLSNLNRHYAEDYELDNVIDRWNKLTCNNGQMLTG